jgi:hypothetical protein
MGLLFGVERADASMRRKRTSPASNILACGSSRASRTFPRRNSLRSGRRPIRLGDAAPRLQWRHRVGLAPTSRDRRAEPMTCDVTGSNVSCPLSISPALWPAFAAKRLRRGLAIARPSVGGGGGGHPWHPWHLCTLAPWHPWHPWPAFAAKRGYGGSRHSPREPPRAEADTLGTLPLVLR